MPNPITRNKSVGAKVTEEEYTELEKQAAARSLTLGEWCREVLLARLNPDPPRPIEELMLAEVLGTRMIVLNMLYALANNQTLSAEEMREMIKSVDQEKLTSVVEKLEQNGIGKQPRSA